MIKKVVFQLGLILVFAVLAPNSLLCAPTTPETDQEKQVRAFVAAFNDRKIDVMLELASDDLHWMTIDGTKISIETEGKVALRESMERYFKSCSSCKSSLEWVQVAGSRVTAMERASWTAKGEAKSQSSLSVYEFRDGKIYRVYFSCRKMSSLPQPLDREPRRR